MKSMIASAVVSVCGTLVGKFRKSKLGALVENVNTAVTSSWKNSVIMRFLKRNPDGESVVKRVALSPFTLLEFIQRKISPKLGGAVEKSVLCETARRYVHSFMALNTRFWGVMLLCASVVGFVGNVYVGGKILPYAVLGAAAALLTIKSVNVTGYFEGSRLVDFVKACAGLKNITFEVYDEERTQGRQRFAGAVAAGVLTGTVMLVSPMLGVLVPFGLFGVLLVLEYPVTGVYAAVFIAPLIPFSSMPLAGVCVLTTVSLVIKSVTDENFRWKRDGVGAALVLFLAVLLVSCVFSFARKESLVVWTMYFVFVTFYFAVVNTIETRQQLTGLIRLLVISGAFVALYGVMQYVFGWTTTNAWIDEEMFEGDTMRVFSTLANPNVLGEYLLLVLPPSIVFFLKDKAKSWSKWVYLAVSGLIFLCLILTQSRGCWLGFMVSAAIFITFYEGRLWALVPLGLCILPFVLPQTIIDRLLSIGNMGDSSTSYRVSIWLGVMGLLKHYLAGGIGMGEGAFSHVYPLFSYNAIVAPHSHNTYLQLLVEGGIPALATFIAVVVLTFKRSHTEYKRNGKKSGEALMILGLCSGLAGFLFQSMFDYTFYNYRVMAVFFMVIAIAMSYTHTAEKSES